MTVARPWTRPRQSPLPAIGAEWSGAVGRLLVALILSGALVAAIGTGSTNLIRAVALVTILVAIASPSTGLLVLATASPLIGRAVMPAPGYPVMLVGGVLLGYVYRLPIERPRLSVGLPVVLILAFLAYVFVQQLPETVALYAGERGREFGSLFFKIVTAAGTAVATALVLRGRSPFPYLLCLVLSGVAASVVAILVFDRATVGYPLINLIPEMTVGERSTGTFADPNHYGLFVASAATLAITWYAGWRGRLLRVLLAVAILVLVVGIAVSQSRTAFIVLFAGVTVGAFVRSTRLGVAVLVGGIVVGALALPLLLDWRLTLSTGSASPLAYTRLESSDALRLESVLLGPQVWLQSPLLGVGTGHYKEFAGIASHNWYMTVLAEQGLVGIIVWLGLLASIVSALRRRPLFARSVGFAVFASFLVGSIFLEPIREDQTSVLIIMSVTAALVADWSQGALGAKPSQADVRALAGAPS